MFMALFVAAEIMAARCSCLGNTSKTGFGRSPASPKSLTGAGRNMDLSELNFNSSTCGALCVNARVGSLLCCEESPP